jgi:hypothetical protein
LPQEKLKSVLCALLSKHVSNVYTNGSHHKEKVSHTAPHLGIASSSTSSGWTNRFKRQHNIVYRTVFRIENIDLKGIEVGKNY